jgi:hypothetical protein
LLRLLPGRHPRNDSVDARDNYYAVLFMYRSQKMGKAV